MLKIRVNNFDGGLQKHMLTYCKDRETGIEYRKYYENIFKIGWESVQKFINERRSKQWGYKEIKE